MVFLLQPREIKEIKEFLIKARRKDAKCTYTYNRRGRTERIILRNRVTENVHLNNCRKFPIQNIENVENFQLLVTLCTTRSWVYLSAILFFFFWLYYYDSLVDLRLDWRRWKKEENWRELLGNVSRNPD